jgi:epoxyqueuosine reductase
MGLSAQTAINAAHSAGFELAGLAPALPADDFARYRHWADMGLAGRMGYLTDHRADLRADPRTLLPSARSILCVGKLYNTSHPPVESPEQGRISRYAWGDDYHDTIRARLDCVDRELRAHEPALESRICVDTAPLLERSYARLAGLGWIGKNTCLINQQRGSWFLLGEILLSADLDAGENPPPDRCGSCTRCIDACPTAAIVPAGDGGWKLDARLCISYFTIELKSEIPEEHRAGLGNHVFGCDICQDVCPWNRRAGVTADAEFEPRDHAYAADLERLLFATPEEFRLSFRGSPVSRAKYSGFLRNVAVAMGNSGAARFREPLRELLERSPDETVREHARWALARVGMDDG